MDLFKCVGMNYFHRIAAVMALTLLWGACSPEKENNATSNNKDTLTGPADMATSAIALDYYGTYTGTIPCASCPGIETRLTLKQDNSFVLEQKYLDEGDSSFIEAGKYIIKDDIVHLKAGTDSTYYWLAENRVYMLDQEMQRIGGALADAYILEKKKESILKRDFSGSYATEAPARSYSQTLNITAEGGKYKVSFSAPQINGEAGCNFSGEGRVENDTLKIALEKPGKPVIMVLVRRDRQTLEVFTLQEEDGHALAGYCTGGATLAGPYRAVENYAL